MLGLIRSVVVEPKNWTRYFFLYMLCSSSEPNEKKSDIVTEEDVEHLCRLVDMKDGGPTWIHVMDRSTPTMSYQGWRRDPKVIGFSNFLL